MARKQRQLHELSFNNHEDALLLPVNPEDPPMPATASNNENWNTTEVGSYKAIGPEGLEQVKIKSFFPQQWYPFCTYRAIPTPESCIALIKKWQKSRRPIRYIVTSAEGEYINEAYAIENFQHYKQYGTGDIYFELTLEQYRFAEHTQVPFIHEKEVLITFVTITYGQTLCEIAEEWLGDSDLWKDIVEWNKLEDWGHLWAATESTHHQLQLNCEEGTFGYDKLKREMKEGVGLG